MGISLIKADKNVSVVTKEEISELEGYYIFKGKEQVDTGKHVYQLAVSTIKSNYPTANGFNISTLNFLPKTIEPVIDLSSFNFEVDQEHQLIIELKLLFRKVVKYLENKNIQIQSGIIQEIDYFDNDEEDEISFILEIVLDNFTDVEELLSIEEEIWNHVEGEETFRIEDNTVIDVIISLSLSEGVQ